MAEPLPFDRCLDVIERAGAELAARAGEAGLQAPVVTCPEWSMADLVAHQGMVHRWAAANLRLDDAAVPDQAEILRTVPPEGLIDWFAQGVGHLLETLRSVAPDVPAVVFLNDAPRPREFWARRQAHETTIHSVDALAGVLGHEPTAAQAAIDDDVAVDGIDELVTGFFTRGRSKIAQDAPLTIAIVPTDSDRRWTLHVADGRLTAERAERGDADSVLTGTASQLFLGLWNRGTEITATGRPGVLERWHELQRVRWS